LTLAVALAAPSWVLAAKGKILSIQRIPARLGLFALDPCWPGRATFAPRRRLAAANPDENARREVDLNQFRLRVEA
jgi:hypothetical protein